MRVYGKGVFMSEYVPAEPKIYHIVHVDKLSSILESGGLLCDAEIVRQSPKGTTIGMSHIKMRRLNELTFRSFPDLHVGDCVPFYFCPRSIMLYLICQGNHPDLGYAGGQEPVIHLEADLRKVYVWARQNSRRWAITDSNAGSYYFDDFSEWSDLDQVCWEAMDAADWRQCKEQKQAEFLLEKEFPWHLVDRVGVYSQAYDTQVKEILASFGVATEVEIKRDWYY